MAESTPPSRSVVDDPDEGRRDALRESRRSLRLIAALLLLLVLVVVPLYLWRRPRAAAIEEAANATASVAVAPNQVTEPAPEARLHTRDGVTIGDAKIIGCHDRGSKRTSAGACDHVPGLESALSKAVLDAASCAGPSAQGAGAGTGTPAGSIAFVVDASYGRHKSPVHVTSQRDGTTMPPKVVAACLAEVKKSLSGASFDPSHAHARYQIEVDATYAGKR